MSDQEDFPDLIDDEPPPPKKPFEEKLSEYMDNALELMKPQPISAIPVSPVGEMNQALSLLQDLQADLRPGPVRIKLISATSTRDLESRLNEFLETCEGKKFTVGERITRIGNELVMQVSWHLPPPQLPVPSTTAENVGAVPLEDIRVDEGNDGGE